MAGRGASIGAWIAWDAYTVVNSDREWLRLQLDGQQTILVTIERHFLGSTGSGSTIISYDWSLTVSVNLGNGPVVIATLTNPWRAFLGRDENTILYNQFPTHRIALAAQVSSEPTPGSYSNDGFIRAYLDDTEIAALTGQIIRGRAVDQTQTGSVIVSVDEIVDRVWVRLSAPPPSTNADGTLTSTPSDLDLFDDFTGGDLSHWTSANYPFTVLTGVGGGGSDALAYTQHAAPTTAWIGSGPFVYRAITRSFTVPVTTVTPPPPTAGPPACAAPVFGGPSSGGVACPAPVLP